MTDEQAERLIREIRVLRGTLVGIVLGLVIGYGAIRIGDALTGNPLTGVVIELSGIRSQLQTLQMEMERNRVSPKVIQGAPIPVPPKEEKK